tara:strand:- start:1784 stop:5272 length:3489 start_codon:yes stop_codon:yes gene_type:complete
MPEVRNLFTGSKMNKDLDERLLPQGEYRDGQNISVSKSEGPDEGVVENILGNSQYSNFNFRSGTEIIGYYVDTNKDRIFIFATNFSDSSPDQLSNFPQGDLNDPAGGVILGSQCIIAYIEGPLTGGNPISGIIVQGNFLNFSKTHQMLGVDLIEDLLFFTDNRNQPRKINIETAISNPTYYTNEDHISVAKFAPFSPISFINQSTNMPTAKDTLSEYLPANSSAVVSSITSSVVQINYGTVDIDITNTTTRFLNINKPELGYFKIDNIFGGPPSNSIQFEYPVGSGSVGAAAMANANNTAASLIGPGNPAFSAGNVLQFEQLNPYYDANFSGDENYLKNKFVRFSYRFKYDDNEYSLMAPFSQPLFVPKQYGYFLDSAYDGTKTRRDEKNTAESGVLKLMENQITRADLIINMPTGFNKTGNLATSGDRILQSQLASEFKVSQVQILLKESDSNAIRVVDEVNVEDNFTTIDRFYSYNYVSNKPYKVLPNEVSLRIHDKVPIKAAAQAAAGNRIIYGNFIEKHASPENLDYNLGISPKFADGDQTLANPERSRIRREYINHTVKQNRSYKVGVVLVDRYGRSSNVILRDESINPGSTPGEFSSLYAPYENVESVLNWPGNSLKIQFNDLIPSNKINGYPGIFSSSNPLGYLSYKIVVQQKEQEYYNVFTPGATSGKIVIDKELGSAAIDSTGLNYRNPAAVSNISIFGDNVNKVPKQLSDVGPTETIYGSETLLYPRVVTKYISNATNYPTVWNPTPAFSESSQVTFKNEFTVNSILSYKDLGDWVGQRGLFGKNSSYPNNNVASPGTNYFDPLYLDASANPFVAQLETSFLVGFAPGVQGNPALNFDRSFSKNLNVFETNPVESELDIYWETSTSGSIVELNKFINNGAGSGIGVDIGTPTSPPIPVSFSLEETQIPYPTATTSWIGEEFQAVDSNNALMLSGTIELASVTDGNGNILNPAPFDLLNTTGLRYRLRSNTYFYYGANSAARTFNINLRILANGDNIVTKTCLLTNEAPSINPSLANNLSGFAWYEGEVGNPSSGSAGSEALPYPIFAVPPGSQRGPNSLIGQFNTQTTVFNGSAGTSLDNLEVKVEKDGTSTAKTFFYFNTVTPDTYIRIVNDQAYLSQNINQKVLLKVIVKDCNGSTGFAFKYYSTWIVIS